MGNSDLEVAATIAAIGAFIMFVLGVVIGCFVIHHDLEVDKSYYYKDKQVRIISVSDESTDKNRYNITLEVYSQETK